MSQAVIVTGATGFVGGHLIDRLPPTTDVVGWRRPGGTAGRDLSHVRWSDVDLGQPADVRASVKAAAPMQIFHLGGAANVEQSFKNAVPHLRANALGTHNLLDAVRDLPGPCRVLVVTSAQIYCAQDAPMTEDTPVGSSSPYGLSKLAADGLARLAGDDGVDVVVARPFNHIGPGQGAGFAIANFARQIARIEAGLAPAVIAVGNLDAARDITDVRDVVDAYLHLMRTGRSGDVYNVCSGRALRIGDVLDMLIARARVRVDVQRDSARLRPQDQPVIQGDASRLRAATGWIPRIPIEQTLEDILAWWRSQVGAGRA